MKLLILISLVTWSSCAKLDRTYLPPQAQTSGGNGNFLQTPIARHQIYQNNGFTRNNGLTGASKQNNFAESGAFLPSNRNDYQQNANYAQDNFPPQSNDYAQNDNSFSQDTGFTQSGNNGFNDFEARPERAQAAFERNAAILRQENTNDGETYAYAYETENGISAEENGDATNGVEAQGGYSYTGDDGQVYSIRYTADQNGFRPVGDHLPTPPPIPEDILKALEQNARDEANGIFDDGTYSEGKYSDDSNDGNGYNDINNGNNFNAGGDNNNFNSGNFNGPSNSFNTPSIDEDDSVVTTNAFIRAGNGGSGFGNQNGITKAYLPPFGRNGQRSQAAASRFTPNNGLRSQLNNQAATGFNRAPSNGFTQNKVQKAYLPPENFGNRGRIQNGPRRQPNNFGRQAFNANQRNTLSRGNDLSSNRGAIKAFATEPKDPSTIYDQPQNFGQSMQTFTGRDGANGANRQYLPPSANLRNSGRGTPRRSGFSARNGYQY